MNITTSPTEPATPVYRGTPDAGCPDCGGTGMHCGEDYYRRNRWDRCDCVRVPHLCSDCGHDTGECVCCEAAAF